MTFFLSDHYDCVEVKRSRAQQLKGSYGYIRETVKVYFQN